MANDATLQVRRAALTELKADTAVTDLVPATEIFPGTQPVRDWTRFIRWGSPNARPLRSSCVDGSLIDVTFHAFAKDRTEDGAVVETAEDHAARIGAAIASCLDRKRLDLEGGGQVRILWRNSQLMQDGADASAWHSVQVFAGRVMR